MLLPIQPIPHTGLLYICLTARSHRWSWKWQPVTPLLRYCAQIALCVFKVKWEEQNYLPSGLNVTNKQIPVIFVKHIPFPWRYTQFKDLTLLL